MTKLWQYLKSPSGPSLQNSSSPHLKIVKLPEGLKWPIGINVFNTLFVRPSQQKTVDRILKTYKNSIPNIVKDGNEDEDGNVDEDDEDGRCG